MERATGPRGRLLVLGLVALQLALGIAWLAASLGAVPEYGDSREYLVLAGTLEVDAYRGVAYPLLLALVDRLPGVAGDLTFANARSTGGAPPGFAVLQVVQIAASAASLAYFLRAVVEPLARAAGARALGRAGFAVLLALLLLDPLVLHFDLAVLSDGLALSASLVFCAALTELGLGTGSRRIAGPLLFAAFVLAAGLRAEKAPVLAGTTLVAIAGWLLLERRASGERGLRSRFTRARALAAAGIVLAGIAVVALAQRGLSGERGRWPIAETILHQRVIFPHLAEFYDELPAGVRSYVSPEDAQRYDEHIREARKVVDRIAGNRGQLRAHLTREMAAVVWRGRWGRTILDVLGDAAENVLPTPSFYARYLLQARMDEAGRARQVRTDATSWTASRMAQDHPRLAALHLGGSLLFLACCAGFLVARFPRAGAGDRAADGARPLALLLPTGAFVVLNAFAFALVADLTHARYALLAHVVLLALVYRAVLGRVAARRSG